MTKRRNNGYPETMTSTTFFMDRALYLRLRMQAAREGIKQAVIIREAVESELERREAMSGFAVRDTRFGDSASAH